MRRRRVRRNKRYLRRLLRGRVRFRVSRRKMYRRYKKRRFYRRRKASGPLYRAYREARKRVKDALFNFYTANFKPIVAAGSVPYNFAFFSAIWRAANIQNNDVTCILSYARSSTYVAGATLNLNGFLRRFKKKWGYKANLARMSLLDRMILCSYMVVVYPEFEHVDGVDNRRQLLLPQQYTPAQMSYLTSIINRVILRSYKKVSDVPDNFKRQVAQLLAHDQLMANPAQAIAAVDQNMAQGN